MTKEERRNYYVRKWLKSRHCSVRDVYNSCSDTKVSLELQIKKRMTTINGSRYRVIGHSCQYFTAAFAFPLGYNSAGKPFWYLRVHSPSKHVDYELSFSEVEEAGLE